MGRQPCCDKVGLKKGPWTAEEDQRLISFLLSNGQCCWRAVPKLAGLLRCGKSCRLRWTNYLRPDLKRGLLSEAEEKIVIDLHAQLGNRWSKIASHLPGRTDNEIKNHWNTHIKKKLRKLGIDPLTHKLLLTPLQQHDPAGDSPEAQWPAPENKDTPVAPVEEAEQHDEETSLLRKSPGFCTDEVPMMHPDEIMVPLCDQPPPTPASTGGASTSTATSYSTSASTSSSSASTSCDDDALLPLLEWPDTMYLTALDDMVVAPSSPSPWDDDCLVQPSLPPVYDDPFNAKQYQRSGGFFDQEPWNKLELF